MYDKLGEMHPVEYIKESWEILIMMNNDVGANLKSQILIDFGGLEVKQTL